MDNEQQLKLHSIVFSKLTDNVTIGKYSSIAEGCYFHTGYDEHLYTSNKKVVFSINWDQVHEQRSITIGNDVWIGYGVSILSNVTIGDGAIIGAHSVIAKDIPPYAVVVGNPQVIKHYRFDPDRIEKLMKMKWWDWDYSLVEERKADMKDIDIFLSKYYEK